MTQQEYDLIVVGAGSGGLTAAETAVRLGVRVALVEKNRIGGDCTWTGCVPSKALLRAARAAHETRRGGQFGVHTDAVRVDMAGVRDYVQDCIKAIYEHETPEVLRAQGIDVYLGGGTFNDRNTLRVGQGADSQTLRGRNFLLATGAHAVIPEIAGLDEVPYHTYESIFENDVLPEHLIVLGAGPSGAEVAQAYARLGAAVTLVDAGVLPEEDPDAADVLADVFAREGIRFVEGLADEIRGDAKKVSVRVGEREIEGDMLLVAVGRAPNVTGLGLDAAGVDYSGEGIMVDQHLRTSQRHIYAAGDCTGAPQFTHVAAYQAFQATRNALLPGTARGLAEYVPHVTFTSPAIGRVGLTEAEARGKYGDAVRVRVEPLSHIDRAVVESDRDGFVKLVLKGRKLVGVTVVAEQAGELLSEYALALANGLSLVQIAGAIHAYPTYAVSAQEAAADLLSADLLRGISGRLTRSLARLWSWAA